MSIEYLSKNELDPYSTKLTEACRTIFGDIVVKACFQEQNIKYKDPFTIEVEVRSQQVLDLVL